MQNKLKALFIMVLLLGGLLGLIHSGWVVFIDRNLYWVPALLSSAAICFIFFVYIGTGKRPRTSHYLPGLLTVTSACAIATLLWNQQGLEQWYAIGVGGIGSWLYVFWYSKLNRSASQLYVGDKLPSLALFDSNNQLLETDDIDGALLLIFYRGNWCPLCVAQIKEVAQHYQNLQERGYSILLISPQPQSETQKMAQKFSIPLLFCEDRENLVARKLGIDHERALPFGMEKMGYAADAVHPTVIITDKQHNILWLDQTDNYRVRPEPENFIHIIDQHLSGASL